MSAPDVQRSDHELDEYLRSWGLREFHDESSYFAWQRAHLREEQLTRLQHLLERRTADESGRVDCEFYDEVTEPQIFPVIYSQRVGYYRTLGRVLRSRIPPGRKVLDVGCGVGVLTTFLAKTFPDAEFVGIDRSAKSIAMAQREASARHVGNVAYDVSHIPHDPIPGQFDLILSTQAVFQSENDPGLPSLGWHTFRRAHNQEEQTAAEARLGIAGRLDALVRALHPHGRMIFYEKTGHLGRRVLFQRALSRRGFHPCREVFELSYPSLEDQVADGYFYEVSAGQQGQATHWDENPSRHPGDTFFRIGGRRAQEMWDVLQGGQLLGRVRGRCVRWGDWNVFLGTWGQALFGLYFEAESGVKGLLTGGMKELQLVEEVSCKMEAVPPDHAERIISDVWGTSFSESSEDEAPGYENHCSSAQEIYMALPNKKISKEWTSEGEAGRAMHVEFGQSQALWYLYWANTFDQRQLVLMPDCDKEVLRTHFEESISGLET